MILKERMTIYHGSYVPIEEPILQMCRSRKDFGKGFYLTTDYEQAKRFTAASINKAIAEGRIDSNHNMGYISAYELGSVSDINCFEFKAADEEWLRCVVNHRKETEDISRWEKYDIIAGKIANDNTNFVITAYIRGAYGDVKSRDAISTAIRLLLPERLKDQICLRTDEAISKIIYQGYEEVTL